MIKPSAVKNSDLEHAIAVHEIEDAYRNWSLEEAIQTRWIWRWIWIVMFVLLIVDAGMSLGVLQWTGAVNRHWGIGMGGRHQ